MLLEESVMLIKKFFSFLFEKHNFHAVFVKEFRPDHYSIGLEANNCKILFYRELSGWNMFIGGSTAKFENEIGEWVLFENLMFYLIKKEIDRSYLAGKLYDERVIASLRDTAKEFEPLSKQIIEMFRSPQVVAQWRPEYDKLIHEETQRRYGVNKKK